MPFLKRVRLSGEGNKSDHPILFAKLKHSA
jgi:hypothetical protein